MKNSMQLNAKVRNLSEKTKIEAETLLRNFMLERFLERISVSRYRESIVLKGGMLIAAVVGIQARSTLDMDATLRGHSLSQAEAASIVEEIARIQLDDGVRFTPRGIEEIREGEIYPSYRASVEAVLDKTRQMLKIDMTAGDVMTPGAIEFGFPLLFEERTINILSYNLETVLAEKLETILARGIANTRMRDFYDVTLLLATKSAAIDFGLFSAALENTAAKRETASQLPRAQEILDAISRDLTMATHWRRYQANYVYAASVYWEETQEALQELVSRYIPGKN